MSKVEELISPPAIRCMKGEITRAGGNEVFFVGETQGGMRVEKVRVVSRGNEVSAPAIMGAASFGEVVIHNHPSGELKPSQADVSVASALGNSGIGFYIVDNEVTCAYVVVEPVREKETEALDVRELASLLEPGGLISRKLNGYEYRPQQASMVEIVARAFNRDGIAMVEAGTGTGKTVAYLLPAIYWAVSNGERVVVSTHTINLQEQLMHKDIPFLQGALGLKFKAVQVIGRGNYICLRKVAHLRKEPELFTEPEEQKTLVALMEWAAKTPTGCRTELSFVPEQALWEKLCSESDYCMSARCPEQKRCFVNTARRQAVAADLLIVNHHLLFADMAVRKHVGACELAILPPYKRLIIDEAHTVEEVATSYFGTQVTRIGLARMLGRLYSPDGGGKGQLPYIMTVLHKINGKEQSKATILFTLEHDLIPVVHELSAFSREVFDAIYQKMEQLSEEGYFDLRLRLTQLVVGSKVWRELLNAEVSEFTARLKALSRKLAGTSKELALMGGSPWDEQSFDLGVSAGRIGVLAADLERILSGGNRDEVAWVEGRIGDHGTKLVRVLSSPVDVAKDLAENLFFPIPTVVLTSATLTVENSFEYLRSRLGLQTVEAGRIEQLILSSPFDYEKQAIIGIPMDIPDPREQEFDESLKNMVYRTLTVTGGKAFVLFTSYRSLDWVYWQLREPLASLGINALKQGERPRHQLLELFKKDKTSVLFATESFWQGVDVEGEALECVILVKLPFRVPTDPVLEARCQYIEEQGRNAFLEYIVPQAVIMFKQGFGRLIRKRTDRGAVLIFDRRIIEKFYGKMFMDSLPPCEIVIGPMEEVLKALRNFYAKAK